MHPTTSNQPAQTSANPNQAAINSAFARKVQYGRIKNLELCEAIRQHVEQELNVKMLGNDRKGDKGYYEKLVCKQTGEYIQDYEALFDAYYTLRASTNVLMANFKDKGRVRPQIISVKHSRHKLDHIWNMRKAQLIRKIWRKVLQEDNLHENYTPMHLVLTVPHRDGTWNGKRYYGQDLVAAYNVMRKYGFFKKSVYGGEYGTETTMGEHGLHTHIHSLVFQFKNVSTNKFRKELQDCWHRLTGGNIHYKTLYVHRKEAGAWIMENVSAKVVRGDEEEFTLAEAYDRRKKFYLDNRNPWYRNLSNEEKQEVYNKAILECIKYHFKNESFKNESGQYDVDFMREVLEGSKGLRMYSKFGAFYGDKRLNYYETSSGEETITCECEPFETMWLDMDGERIEVTEHPVMEEMTDEEWAEYYEECKRMEAELKEILPDEPVVSFDRYEDEIIEIPHYDYLRGDNDEEPMGSINNSLQYLTNPFTGEPAKEGDYELVIAYPEDLKITTNTTTKTCWINYGNPDDYFRLRKDIDLKMVMKSLYTNKYHEILEYDDIQRFLRHKTRAVSNKQIFNN